MPTTSVPVRVVPAASSTPSEQLTVEVPGSSNCKTRFELNDTADVFVPSKSVTGPREQSPSIVPVVLSLLTTSFQWVPPHVPAVRLPTWNHSTRSFCIRSQRSLMITAKDVITLNTNPTNAPLLKDAIFAAQFSMSIFRSKKCQPSGT